MKLAWPLLLLLFVLALPIAAQANQPWMGVALEVVAKPEADQMGIPGGLKVTRVDAGSPAEQAGLMVGDVVLSAGEAAMTSIEGLRDVLADMRPGDFLSLGVRRESGRNEPVLVTLGARGDTEDKYADDARVKELRDKLRGMDAERRKLFQELQQRLRELAEGKADSTAETAPPAVPEPPKRTPPTPIEPERAPLKVSLGASCRNLEPAEAKALGIRSGVYFSEVPQGGPAYEAGSRTGDVLTHVDDETVTGTGDLRTILSRHEPGDRIELTLLRDGKSMKVTVLLRAR